jgi:hypothetical protein
MISKRVGWQSGSDWHGKSHIIDTEAVTKLQSKVPGYIHRYPAAGRPTINQLLP